MCVLGPSKFQLNHGSLRPTIMLGEFHSCLGSRSGMSVFLSGFLRPPFSVSSPTKPEKRKRTTTKQNKKGKRKTDGKNKIKNKIASRRRSGGSVWAVRFVWETSRSGPNASALKPQKLEPGACVNDCSGALDDIWANYSDPRPKWRCLCGEKNSPPKPPYFR